MVKRTFALKNADRFEWGDRQPVEGRQEAVTDIKITFVDPKERQARPYLQITGLQTPSPEGLLCAVRAGGCATPTGFAVRANAQANHAPTFKSDNPLGAD